MKWLEVIQIRAVGNRSEKLLRELTKMLAERQEESGVVNTELFRHASLPTDFSLHLTHQSDTNWSGKSQTGLMLTSVAKEFGLVNHTVWVADQRLTAVYGEATVHSKAD